MRVYNPIYVMRKWRAKVWRRLMCFIRLTTCIDAKIGVFGIQAFLLNVIASLGNDIGNVLTYISFHY